MRVIHFVYGLFFFLNSGSDAVFQRVFLFIFDILIIIQDVIEFGVVLWLLFLLIPLFCGLKNR